MNNKYDVVVIGGGHNGLVNAAYLARAGKKVLVLERRHVLGGAAVTEEVFPGFKFSVCSYVVSLLRPEIIRELDLPRHGLEILPLDGTFTPMPSGDYLWRVNDHARTRREIARHSRLDAEAYDEYGRAMIEMAHFVKPIMSMTPPDPTTLDPKGWKNLAFLARRFQKLPEDDKYNQVQLMTMSASISSRRGRTTPRPRCQRLESSALFLACVRLVPRTSSHHHMGEIMARFARGILTRIGRDPTRLPTWPVKLASIRTEAPIAKILIKNGRATGVVLNNGDETG